MVVVSNTSPLTNLSAIGQFVLLQKLFGEIQIADGVWQELNARGRRYPGSREVEEAPWVHRCTVSNRSLVTALRQDLDLGEAETLVLGVELGADLVLVDEKEGRHMASRLGLRILGTLGLLLEAKREEHVSEVRSLLEALRLQAGFYLREDLLLRVLAMAGEKA